ncbi:glycosyltransferase family 4 protein [Nocardia camponoti]|uniref:Glycosyl transferase n=1 Tax=Nocardia camponoti TaxID=1616106 RepID=A0A917V3V4_9NOCA|nr:glycosyltransferase family 4 protein [Nocardia camponoti]GGK33544.1 glycosyl transferase [Nocardia camponoti]
MSHASRDLLFIAHTGQASGAENVMLSLVEVALMRGDRVRVACPDGPLCARLPDGVSRVVIPPLGLTGERGARRLVAASVMFARWARAAFVLRKPLRSSQVDVIINSTMALPAVALARPDRATTTWLVHDILASGRQYAAARAGRRAVRHAVAVSEAAATPVRAQGISVSVAVNGVTWPVDAASAPAVREPAVIGILGVITEWKGHHVLLDAVARVPDVVVEIAGSALPGDEEYLAQLRTRAAKPDLAGRVRFLGRVDALPTLRGWDALVSASVLPEAGQLVVLEAMSVGIPVIATDHGGYADERVMVCVPPNDAGALAKGIAGLVTDLALRQRLSLAGRARVRESHDRSVTVLAMLDALVRE